MTAPKDDTHNCPACGAPDVPHSMLACKPCWQRLPEPIRRAIKHAYWRRAKAPEAHRAAIGAAMRWYRANPAEPTP